MTGRAARIGTAVTLAALLLFAGAGPAAADAAAGRTAIVLLAPYLTWEDITPQGTPTLWRMVEDGAVANLNPRTATRLGGPSVTRGALTISAGTWANAESDAPGAYDAVEPYGGAFAASAYPRFAGRTPADGYVVYLGFPSTMQANRSDTAEVSLGALGQAVRRAGGRAAAFGNSDTDTSTPAGVQRPAALVAMDAYGWADGAIAGADLLEPHGDSPFGVRTSRRRLLREMAESLTGAAGRGPSLVVIDVGDLNRAREFARFTTPWVERRQHAAAVRLLDWAAGVALASAPDDAVVMVVPVAVEDPLVTPAGFGPVIVSGSGQSGYLVSSTTHRPGMVTGIDVGPTALRALGVAVPAEMTGNPMSAGGEKVSAEERISYLTSMNTGAVTVDTARWWVTNGFILFALVTWLVGAFFVVRGDRFPKGRSRFQAVLLLLLSYPVSAWLMFAVVRFPPNAPVAVALQLTVALAVWAGSLALRRRFGAYVPVIALMALATVVLLVDQWSGAPLSLASFFSYSPLIGWRYYGLGNEGAAIVVGASLAALGLLLEAGGDAGWTRHVRLWGVPAVGLTVIATGALPFFGANFGLVVWGLFGFAFAWATMNGIKFDWKAVVVTVVVIALVVVGMSLLDIGGSGESRTHLGKAVSGAQESGLQSLVLLVVRKLSNNLRILTRTFWAALFAVILLGLIWLRVRPQGELKSTFARFPDFTRAFTGCMIAGAVGFFTEDSGVVVPAIIMFFASTALMYLMLLRAVGSAESAGQGDAS